MGDSQYSFSLTTFRYKLVYPTNASHLDLFLWGLISVVVYETAHQGSWFR